MLKYRKKSLKNILFGIFLLPIFVVVIVCFYIFCIQSPVKTGVVFDVVRGDSVTGVANRLVKNNLIESADLFIASVRFHGGKIQSGQYEIPRGASLWRVTKMLVSGDVATTTVVIPEGLTIKQIKNMLLQNSELTGAVECSLLKKFPAEQSRARKV